MCVWLRALACACVDKRVRPHRLSQVTAADVGAGLCPRKHTDATNACCAAAPLCLRHPADTLMEHALAKTGSNNELAETLFMG